MAVRRWWLTTSDRRRDRNLWWLAAARRRQNMAALLAALSAHEGRSLPALLVPTLIVRGPRTTEGTLIEAVTLPWIDLIEFLLKDPSAAYQVPCDKWEEIIAGVYKKAGFDEVILTPRSVDFGCDVIAEKKGVCAILVIDQVKAYGPSHLVTANDVRALFGVLRSGRWSIKSVLDNDLRLRFEHKNGPNHRSFDPIAT
jgi:Restriction endonuclease